MALFLCLNLLQEIPISSLVSLNETQDQDQDSYLSDLESLGGAYKDKRVNLEQWLNFCVMILKEDGREGT